MNIVGQALHPMVSYLGQRPASVLRREHARAAMMQIALTIRDLLTTIPLSFLNGAINGPILLLGTFAFGAALVPADSTLLGTMGSLAFYAGTATMLLAIIPRIDECIRKVATHLLWVCKPKAMEREALRQQSVRAARILMLSIGACATIAALKAWGPTDPLGLKQRFSVVPNQKY